MNSFAAYKKLYRAVFQLRLRISQDGSHSNVIFKTLRLKQRQNLDALRRESVVGCSDEKRSYVMNRKFFLSFFTLSPACSNNTIQHTTGSYERQFLLQFLF